MLERLGSEKEKYFFLNKFQHVLSVILGLNMYAMQYYCNGTNFKCTLSWMALKFYGPVQAADFVILHSSNDNFCHLFGGSTKKTGLSHN